MFKQIITYFACLIFGFASMVNAESITFESNSKSEDGKPLILNGELLKPVGNGPFSAVVLLPGCASTQTNNTEWAKKLVNWGYVTFLIDSLGARNTSYICDSSDEEWMLWYMRGAQDVHDAKNYLTQLSFIDKNRIAVIGWSYGGGVVIESISKSRDIKNRGNPFKAAIAFYPYCYAKWEGFESPLLILIGELDKMTPAALCKNQMVSKTSISEVVLKTYPGAQHSFDRYKLARDAVADSVVQVKNFLTKHVQ